jgi:hypothetical protein
VRARWLFVPLVLLLVLAGSLFACPSPDTVSADQVMTLSVCDGSPCTAPANGNSVIPVSLCVPGDDPRAPGLTATLTLSRGRWQTPTDPSNPLVYTGTLAGVACVTTNAVAPSDLAPLFVYASVRGFTTSKCVQMAPPPIAFVQMSSSPPVLANNAQTSVGVTATPIGDYGYSVPTSTTVTFSITTITPPDTLYALQPTEEALVDGAVATTVIVTAPDASSVTISATAQVPAPEPCPGAAAGEAGAPVSGMLVVPLLPEPESNAASDAGADATSD